MEDFLHEDSLTLIESALVIILGIYSVNSRFHAYRVGSTR